MLLYLALLAADCPATDPEGRIPPDAPQLPVGAVEPEWCTTGIDLIGRLGLGDQAEREIAVTLPGGQGYAMRFQRGAFVPPAGWRVIDTLPGKAPAQGGFSEILVDRRSDRVMIVTTNPAWQVGNAICLAEGGTDIAYLVVPGEPTDADLAQVKSDLTERKYRQPATVCLNAWEEGPGYRFTFHDSRGRTAREMDEAYAGTEIRIQPAAAL